MGQCQLPGTACFLPQCAKWLQCPEPQVLAIGGKSTWWDGGGDMTKLPQGIWADSRYYCTGLSHNTMYMALYGSANSKLVPTPGPWHWLFPLPGTLMVSPDGHMTCFRISCDLLKSCFFRKVSSDLLTKMVPHFYPSSYFLTILFLPSSLHYLALQ